MIRQLVILTFLLLHILGGGAFGATVPDFPYLAQFSFRSLPLPAALRSENHLIKQSDENLPDWKHTWDEARGYARAAQFKEAARVYQQLLGNKDVREGRWELANVLIQLGHNQEAMDIIEILCEQDSSRIDYMNGLAVLSLKFGGYRRAAEFYLKIHERQPENLNALAGALYCTLALGDKQAALPLMERLFDKDRSSRALREALAITAYELGQYQTAAKHLQRLIAAGDAKLRVVLLAARVHVRLNLLEKAHVYWQQVLKADQGNIEAHQWLAGYFENSGQVQEALPHLLFINEQNRNDPELLMRIGQCYIGMKKFSQALPYLEEYVAINPDDRVALKFVVNIHAALGNKKETLEALEHYFDIAPHPDEANLKRAAKLYDEQGLYREAIDIYRRLLELSPDDPEILTAMADNFLAVGDEAGVLVVWKHLARLVPGVIELYRPMAALLEQLGREQELVDVLEAIYELEPLDLEIAVKLAGKYLKRDEYDKAEKIINNVKVSSEVPPDFYYLRALLRERKGEFGPAVDDFENLLSLKPDWLEARIHCVTAAGHLGELARVERHYSVLRGNGKLDPENMLIVGRAFFNCGAYTRARKLFNQVAEAAGDVSKKLILRAVNGIADTYKLQPYEAEEALRVGLALTGESQNLLLRLFELSLAFGKVGEAGQWLNAFKRTDNGRLGRLLSARLLVERGERRQARRIARLLLKDVLKEGRKSGFDDNLPVEYLNLAVLMLDLGLEDQAQRLCRSILAEAPLHMEAKIIYMKARGAAPVPGGEIDPNRLEVSQLLELASLYEKYGFYGEMEFVARLAQTRRPSSFSARLLVAESLTLQGKLDSAENLWKTLYGEQTAESYISDYLARLYFMSGRLDEAEELCGPLVAKESRPNLQLLLARINWRRHNWKESIRIYQNFMEPDVASQLREQSQALGFELPALDLDRSIWEVIGGDPPKNRDLELVRLAMAPRRVMRLLKGNDVEANLVTAHLFARGRWQQRFAAELAARKSVQRREYFLAQRLYEGLIKEYPEDKSFVFDLAGVYSRLGRLGEEAAAYESLRADHVYFPELQRAISRNSLKQRPLATTTVGYAREEGRRGHKDIKRDWQQLSFWYSPHTRRELTTKLSRINYHAAGKDDVLRATRALVSYQAMFSGLTVKMGGGIESQDSGAVNTALINLEAEAKLGDKLVSSLVFDRDIVSDTTAALRRELVQNKVRGGITFEPHPRLELGGAYEFTDYSDDNWSAGYDLWSSYILFAEPRFLKVYFNYDFRDSKEGALSGTVSVDGFAAADHPYWSPKNYWSNQVGAFFKHSLSKDVLGRGAPTYYTAEYFLGHDSDGNGSQTAKGGVYVELSSNFMIEASVELTSSPVYRKKSYQLSADYRW